MATEKPVTVVDEEAELQPAATPSPTDDQTAETASHNKPHSHAVQLVPPKDWPAKKKWISLMILSSFAFVHPLSETMIAPSMDAIARDLHFTDRYDSMLCLSIFLVGIAVGPLIFAPLSEVYGRRPILLSGGAFYTLWTIACGFAKTRAQIFTFRVFSGFGASVALALGGGVIGDVWKAEERGRALGWYLLAPLLGPAIGPIVGGFISDSESWRWVFWAFSIASAAFLLVAALLFPESYEPRLLEQLERANRTNVSQFGTKKHIKTASKLLRRSLIRPVRIISTQPTVNILAVFMALLYGIMFLFLFTYPLLWIGEYQQSVGISSLNYISAGLGFTLGAQIAGHVNDHVYAKLKRRNADEGKPEYRVPILVPGAVLVIIGLLIYGWAGESITHWIVPNIGSFIFCTACMLCTSGVNTYAIDAYTQYAASAISALNVLRNVTAILFPLFAPYMYQRLGFGVGFSILAGAWAVFSFLVIGTMWLCGERLRTKYPFSA